MLSAFFTMRMLSGWALAMLFPMLSMAQLNWAKYEGNPVLEGYEGDWDWNCWSPVVIHEDGIFKMWYQGAVWDNERQIGYATSVDGIEWTKDENNPVIPGGEAGHWDHHRYPGSVLRVNDTLKMWWCGSVDSGSEFQIGYAWSVEDNEWNLLPDPVLEIGATGNWDDFLVLDPRVYYDGSTYHMYYTGVDDELMADIGYATSDDGINWTKYGDPVIEHGFEGFFYSQWANSSGLLAYNGKLHMFFNGFDGTTIFPHMSYFRVGYAWSDDYVTWHIENGYNPVVWEGGAGAWDDRGVRGPSVIVHNGKLKMWYAGIVFSGPIKLGYALGDTVLTGVDQPDVCNANPGTLQVSPNPFTRDAVISFYLAEQPQARVEVLNGSGQVVAVPADGILGPGMQSVTLDGRELPAGVYVCVLKTAEGVVVRKVVKR